MLRMLWILSAATSNSDETRHVLLDAIRSSNSSPEVLVAVVNCPEYQQILHAQRRIDGGLWHAGHRLDPNEVVGQFLDTLKLVGEQTQSNSNAASASSQIANLCEIVENFLTVHERDGRHQNESNVSDESNSQPSQNRFLFYNLYISNLFFRKISKN